MRLNLESWRKSASLILAAKSFQNSIGFNYKILCIKRSANQKFMPKSYVFPGGNMAKEDESLEWLKLYENHGYSLKNKSFDDLIPETSLNWYEPRPPETIPKYISSRICAIRETFEECGILLCRSLKNQKTTNLHASFITGPEVIKWQDIVHENPAEFLRLCQNFDVYPDLWALKLWANWMTPPSFPTKFDTIFFVSCVTQEPPVHMEPTEVVDTLWSCPGNYLNLAKDNSILLPPPQFYELSRLKRIPDFDNLASFAHKRSFLGSEEFLPFKVKSPDGDLSIFPGDGLYPPEMSEENFKIGFLDETEATVKNRMTSKNGFIQKLIIENYVPKFNHIIPVV